MKKRILGFTFIVSILLSTTGLAYENPSFEVSPDKDAVIEVTTSYLEQAAYARYFYDQRNTEQYTIASISEHERNALSQRIAAYPSFRATQDAAPYAETSLNDGTLLSAFENLTLHQNSIAYYGHLNELEQITYEYFTPSYEVVACDVNADFATVNVFETLDFQYSDCEDPSMMITHYFISLVKDGNDWFVVAVESDDLFYQEYRETGMNLQQELASIDAAFKMNEELQAAREIAPNNNESQGNARTAATTARTYKPQNAVNYALTYSSSGDDGNSVPSYRNTKFFWTNESCQLFVSQCIWAGFGGSNTQTDINNRRGMDTSGSYQWWSTKTLYNNPEYNDPDSLSDKGWNSWVYCPQFKVYVDAVKNSSDESGVVCDTYAVPYNSDNMVGTSGLTKTDLIGAALHVKGSSGALGHAIIVNNATGTTRDKVYYTSYNNCAKNILLSTSFPSNTTSSNNKIYVMVPRTLREGNGATENYLYGDLQNALVKGTSGVTRTLYGRANSAVATLTMRVYAPNATIATHTFSATNKTVVSGSVLFNQVGEWRVVVSGTGLTSFTYLVRVV